MKVAEATSTCLFATCQLLIAVPLAVPNMPCTQVLVMLKEGKKFNHPGQPTKLKGWSSVCATIARHHIKASYDVPADQWLVPEPHKPGHNF